jgi:hypothetical protein
MRFIRHHCILEDNRPHVYYEAHLASKGGVFGVGHTKEQAAADLRRQLTPANAQSFEPQEKL